MTEPSQDESGPRVYKAYRPIRRQLRVIFACLTALPFLVFAFIYFSIGAFNTALSGGLIALSLILVLEGFILFRRMAEHIEQLSTTIADAGEGKIERAKDSGNTRELAVIADVFNRTLSKLELTAKDLGVKAIQASTLNEIREIVSKTIVMEEVAALILKRAMRAVHSSAGYLAVKHDDSPLLHVAAKFGFLFESQNMDEIDPRRSLAGLALRRRVPIVINDIEAEEKIKAFNIPDIGLPRLVYLSIVAQEASIGVLALGKEREEPPFHEEDVEFLQTLLQQIAYSFENARLYTNLQKSKQDLEIAMAAQKQAQDQLLASARMAAFGELSVNIAHELNNPLTGILGYSDLLLGSRYEDGEATKMLEMIRAQAERAGRITKSLLDSVSQKSGSKVEANVNDLVKRALILARGKISGHGIRLHLKLAEKLPPVLVDPGPMEGAFFNFISNAVNAMTGVYGGMRALDAGDGGAEKRGPIIAIRTGEESGKVYVSIGDTGPGIKNEDRSRIFEPFFSTQEKVSQVGLGLWVSDRIVEAQGGEIRCESEEGKGTRFIVRLPAKTIKDHG